MKVNWLCPRPAAPSGGVLFIHQFARILNENGILSQVVQSEPFRVWWDSDPVPDRVFTEQLPISASDITVIPETMWHDNKAHWPNPIVFCQNWMWLDKRIPLDDAKIIVCSRHLSNYVQSNYIGGNVIGIVHPYVNSKVFHFPEHQRVKDRVTIINRRNDLGEKLKNVLKSKGWVVDYIGSSTDQHTIANHLGLSDYYVHLISPEGWPQICAEAMQSGSVVVGTTGGSGNEFMFHKETAMVLQDTVYGYNVTDEGMLNQAVGYLNELRENATLKESIRTKAHEWTGQYTEDKSKEELLKIFGGMA